MTYQIDKKLFWIIFAVLISLAIYILWLYGKIDFLTEKINYLENLSKTCEVITG